MRNIAMLTNMKDYNVEKEYKVPIPNKILGGFGAVSREEKDMQQSKIIHLYYSLALNTPMGIDFIPCVNLSYLCDLAKVKAQAKTIAIIKDRLKILEQQRLIKIKADLESLKKNDNFSIEMIFTEELMKSGFTFLNAREIELFFKLDVNVGVVFLCLKRYYNKEKGYAFITYEYMSEDLGMSKATISSSVEFLIELGVITKDNPNFYTKDSTGQIRNSNNRYYIANIEAVEEAVRKIDNNEVDIKLNTKTKKEVVEPVEEVKEIPSLGEIEMPSTNRNTYRPVIDTESVLKTIKVLNEIPY